MVFGVRDVQRSWLEITAMIDFMQIYKPRMDGRAPRASSVADTLGVFTHEVRVAQDYVTAGLPCWLIRPASDFTNQNILKVVQLQRAEGIITLTAHQFAYPVIFSGSAGSSDKYESIHRYARNFLRAPDPFNTSTGTETVSPTASSNPLQAPPPLATSSSTQPFAANSARNSTTRQAKYGRQKNRYHAGKCISAYDHTVSHPSQVIRSHMDVSAATRFSRSRTMPLFLYPLVPGSML
jgi:hypothetical protein